jgi:hypothetical protein
MTREIRISVDDDEVFERMRERKRRLDLSWEEVLHRGLRRHPDERIHTDRGGWSPPERDLAEDLQREIRTKVANSIRGSFGEFDPDLGWDDDLDDEMSALAAAEDALLLFEGMRDDPGCQLPLRVSLRTGPEGLAVEVVAIRQGKGVETMNRFTPTARKEITGRLARGETATLRIDEGEEYAVVPSLVWSRDGAGRPVITEAIIDEVRFDDGR